MSVYILLNLPALLYFIYQKYFIVSIHGQSMCLLKMIDNFVVYYIN